MKLPRLTEDEGAFVGRRVLVCTGLMLGLAILNGGAAGADAGPALIAIPIVGMLLGIGSGLARVYEARRYAAGYDERTTWQRVRSGLQITVIWASGLTVLCYTMVQVFG